MGIRGFFYNIWVVIFLCFPLFTAQSAVAASPQPTAAPLTTKLYYEARFAGLLIGKAGIELDAQPTHATVTCDISTAGLVGLFFKHSSHTTLSATGEHFLYPNRTYESHYRTRKKRRFVKMIYQGGIITSQEIYPPENRDKRPEVPAAERNAAYDLMSFLLQLRAALPQAVREKQATLALHTYDGRRLTEAHFAIGGTAVIELNGTRYTTQTATAHRKPLAGYTDDERESITADEPGMTLYFSQDERFIPLQMEIPFLLQKLRVTLEKTCSEQESCLLGISE